MRPNIDVVTSIDQLISWSYTFERMNEWIFLVWCYVVLFCIFSLQVYVIYLIIVCYIWAFVIVNNGGRERVFAADVAWVLLFQTRPSHWTFQRWRDIRWGLPPKEVDECVIKSTIVCVAKVDAASLVVELATFFAVYSYWPHLGIHQIMKHTTFETQLWLFYGWMLWSEKKRREWVAWWVSFVFCIKIFFDSNKSSFKQVK